MALSPLDSGTELAKCQCCNRRTIKKDGSGDEDAARSAVHKESRLAEETPKMWKQPKGEDRTEMKKEARVLVCTVLNGSAWSTEKKYLSRYKGKCEMFFGVEHRLRKEEMEEQFNREAKEGWRFAADAARITDEWASREDRKHTSGGVFVAADSNLGAVVGAEEGAVVSISSNEGRIAQARVNVRGGVRVFSVYFWHSDGWIRALLEAVAKQAHTTRHSWLVACDANMCPEDFERSLLFRRERMHVVAPKEASTCKSEGSKGEWIERTYDYVIACNSLAQSGVLFGRKRKQRYRIGMSRSCRRCFLASVEEGCQGEAKRRKRRTAERDK